jgi:hypothetical protein
MTSETSSVEQAADGLSAATAETHPHEVVEESNTENINGSTVQASDPTEILPASLNFERSHHNHDDADNGINDNNDQQRGQKQQKQSPRHETVALSKSRKCSQSSSRSSLYPSLEFVAKTASDFDSDQVEQSWQNAAVVSLRKRQQVSSITSSNGVGSDDSRESSRREYPLSYSGFNGFDGTALSPSTGSMGVSTALSETSATPMLGSPSMPAAAPGILFRNMHDTTASASALGSPTDPAPLAASMADLGNFQNDAYISSEPTHNREDDDMIAMKMAAAYGGGMSTSCTVTSEAATAVPDDFPDQAAEATIVEYGMIHPLEEETVVQAEFVCSSEFEANAMDQHENYANDALAQPTTISQPVDSTNHSGADLAAEATVIASGPAEKATEAAWSANDAREAVVLQEEQRETSYGSIDDLDTKPPAIPVIRDCDIGVLPLEQGDMVVNSFSQEHSFVADDHIASSAVATVVDYDVHPSEMTSSSVQAEFLGSSQIELGFEQITPATMEPHIDHAEHVFEVHTTEDATATEATVVDSGPAHKATAEAWSTGAAEIAQVLDNCIHRIAAFSEHVDSDNSILGRTMVAIESDRTGNNGDQEQGVAEIVAITEIEHPSELVSEDTAATAELLGSAIDSPEATASPVEAMGPPLDRSAHEIVAHNESTIVVNSNSAALPHEAEVTLVVDNGAAETTRVVFAQTSSVATGEEPSQNNNEANDNQLEAVTAVAVLEVEQHMAASGDDFYDYPLKPSQGRIASRAQSEPTRVASDHGQSATSSEEGPTWPDTPPMAVATRVENSGGSTASAPPALHAPSPPTVPAVESSPRSRQEHGGVHLLTNNLSRGTSNVMEMLFGNTRPGVMRNPISFEMDSLTATVLPRILLPSSVIYSEATQSWVATVNTNQKALDCNDVEESSKALRAFSVPTKKQAICLARAWAPPRMHPFESNPQCFICETSFAVFRRACHCRNCGVCICSSCSLQWPSKMLPATYNIKKEGTVNICKACDWLCSSFRLALLNGDYDKAITLYETGNVNLTTPFANVKGELL